MSPGTDFIQGHYYKIGSKGHKKALQGEAKANDAAKGQKRKRQTEAHTAFTTPPSGHKLGGCSSSSRLLGPELLAAASNPESPMVASLGSPSPANALAASTTWTSAENPSPILQPELDYDDLNPMVEVSDDSQGATKPDDDERMTQNDSMQPGNQFLDWSTVTPWGGP